ncbi:MAG: vegetative protein [Bacillota bacterium]
MPCLTIDNLHVNIDQKPILCGVNLKLKGGEIHVLMGPNGTGKSTLASALMGHPTCQVTKGTVTLNGKNMLEMNTDERARAGLFLAMQYPSEISGITNADFMRSAYHACHPDEKPLSLLKFIKKLETKMQELGIDKSFAHRYLNDGFSGGEKKRNEILQLLMLEPQIAVLDEVDSGLDIDGLKIVANNIQKILNEDLGLLIITHYQRLLEYLKPNFVHLFMHGKIVQSGDYRLALELERTGYGGSQLLTS